MTELPDRFEYKHSKELSAEGDSQGLIEALEHSDVQKSRFLRGRVIRYLGNLADPQAVPTLIDVLESDPEAGARMWAAIALGKVKDAVGLVALRHAMGDPDKAVAVWAIESLGRLRDRESVDELIERLDDRESWIRQNSARALGRIGDHRATAPLIEHLDDRKALVRKAVALALVNLGDSNAIDPMREVHARISPFRRYTLSRALRELENRFR
jgi:HEAT repeat protein